MWGSQQLHQPMSRGQNPTQLIPNQQHIHFVEETIAKILSLGAS